MALELTTLTPLPTLFGFSGLDEAYRDQSQVPRQACSFNSSANIIPVPNAGDTQATVVKTILPIGYAYVLLEASMVLDSLDGGANNFLDTMGCFAIDSIVSARRTYESFFAMTSPGLIQSSPQSTTKSRVYQTAGRAPKHVILPAEGQQAQISFRNDNTVADDGQYRLSFRATFLMYDISQSHHFAVNTPQLVR